MGLKTKFEDDEHASLRSRNKKYYYEGNGKKTHQLRYMIKVNNISKEELEQLETLDEKLEYCKRIHIVNKYSL
jgi:hypothetical protein